MLKTRQQKEAVLPIAKNLRAGNYIQAVADEVAERSTPALKTVTFKEEVRDSQNSTLKRQDQRSDTIMEDASKETPAPVRRPRLNIHKGPIGISKEKLSKVLGRVNGPEKLTNLLLNQRIENITV